MNGAGRGLRIAAGASLLAGLLLLTAGVSSSSAGTSAHQRRLTIYSVAAAVQYLNNQDDESRGLSNNPFDDALNKLKPKLSFAGNGPFAGDVAVFSFKLYDSPSLKHSAGTASFTCYYNYARKALCDADFELRDGSSTLVASGPVDFNATRYQLIVTGGTSKYLGARGELSEVPATKGVQRLDVVLLG